MSNLTAGDKEPSTHSIYGEKVLCQGQKCVFCLLSDKLKQYQDLILGKVLTVIDASITSGEQQKAVKDLIKGIFYQQFNDVDEGLSWTLHWMFVDGVLLVGDSKGIKQIK